MKGDALLFIAIFVFIFILWVYEGGPTHPISFSGPYITPVTNVGQTSTGYGPTNTSAGSAIWQSVTSSFHSNSQSYYGNSSGGNASARIDVHLNGGNTGATNVDQEYVMIRSNANVNVDITGWKLVSEKTGVSATIPRGTEVAEVTGPTDIILKSGDTAYVTSGFSPTQDSFRETKCTAYLDATNIFSPSLSTYRCPSPIDELTQFYNGDAQKYDQCANYVRSISNCRLPNYTPQGTPSACTDFAYSHFSYNGCLSRHRSDSDFAGTTWRVFLGQKKELWRSSNDTIDLVDASGNIVDTYSY